MRRVLPLLILLVTPLTPAESASIRYEQRSSRRISLDLPPEMGVSWRAVNVGRVQVRSTKRQTSLATGDLPAAGSLDLPLEAPGCSLVQVDIGPPSFKGRLGSWRRVTRCSKIVACTSTNRAMRSRSNAIVTAKTGSRIEIRPLLNPAVLVPGSDLPLRLYWEGSAVEGGTIRATGPAGRSVKATSDGVGIAFVRIPEKGRWVLRFSHNGAQAELVFDVP